MTNKPHDPEKTAPSDGPLARLVDDPEGTENPGAAIPRPPQPSGGRDDYADGTREHDDDRDV